MNKLTANILSLMMLGILAAMLSGCRQELCYDHYPVINVSFSWEQEWEREYGQYHLDSWDSDLFGCEYDELRPGVPEWVNMVSYHEDGRKTDSFMSPDGRSFIVEAGKSRSLLLYNGGTEYIVLSDVASLNNARATSTTRTRAGSSLAAPL